MKIDPYIKPLVDEFNKLEGITTTGSCEGHSEDNETYIAFEVKDLLSLNSIGNRISIVFTELYYKIPKNTIFTGGLEYHTQFKNNETLPSFSFHFITNNLKWRHECIAFFIKRFREIREKHGTEAKNIQLNESLLVKKLIEEESLQKFKELEKIKIIKIIDEHSWEFNKYFLKRVNEIGRSLSILDDREKAVFHSVALALKEFTKNAPLNEGDLLRHAWRVTNVLVGKRPSPHREERR